MILQPKIRVYPDSKPVAYSNPTVAGDVSASETASVGPVQSLGADGSAVEDPPVVDIVKGPSPVFESVVVAEPEPPVPASPVPRSRSRLDVVLAWQTMRREQRAQVEGKKLEKTVHCSVSTRKRRRKANMGIRNVSW